MPRPRKQSERISIRRIDDDDEIPLSESTLARHVHFGFCEQIEYDDQEESLESIPNEKEKLSKLKRLENKLSAQWKFSKRADPNKPQTNSSLIASINVSKTFDMQKPDEQFDDLGRVLSAENLNIISKGETKPKRNHHLFRWTSFRMSKNL